MTHDEIIDQQLAIVKATWPKLNIVIWPQWQDIDTINAKLYAYPEQWFDEPCVIWQACTCAGQYSYTDPSLSLRQTIDQLLIDAKTMNQIVQNILLNVLDKYNHLES